MKFGMVGLGRMGSALVRQALEKKHEVVGYNRNPEATKALEEDGLLVALSLDELVRKLEAPRIVLIYVPHGNPTDSMIKELAARLNRGDIIVDGGNSHWKESIGHYEQLQAKGIHLLDVGTSGGIEGARHGACFMAGGDREAFDRISPILRDLAVPEGVLYAGPAGAGHFAKLVHNAIEFGMVRGGSGRLDRRKAVAKC